MVRTKVYSSTEEHPPLSSKMSLVYGACLQYGNYIFKYNAAFCETLWARHLCSVFLLFLSFFSLSLSLSSYKTQSNYNCKTGIMMYLYLVLWCKFEIKIKKKKKTHKPQTNHYHSQNRRKSSICLRDLVCLFHLFKYMLYYTLLWWG